MQSYADIDGDILEHMLKHNKFLEDHTAVRIDNIQNIHTPLRHKGSDHPSFFNSLKVETEDHGCLVKDVFLFRFRSVVSSIIVHRLRFLLCSGWLDSRVKSDGNILVVSDPPTE